MATRRYAGWCDDCQKRQESWEPAAVDRKSKGSNYDMGQKETSFAYFKTRNELLDNQKASWKQPNLPKRPKKAAIQEGSLSATDRRPKGSYFKVEEKERSLGHLKARNDLPDNQKASRKQQNLP